MEKSTPKKSLSLLASPHVVELDGTEHRIVSRKGCALLAYLADKQKPVPREELATLLWPDKPESNSRNNLSGELKRLSELIPDGFATTYQSVTFSPGDEWIVDVWLVNEAVKQKLAWPNLSPVALAHLQQDRPVYDFEALVGVTAWVRMGGANELTTCASLYRGEFLSGVTLNNCPDLEVWLVQQRTYWVQQMLVIWQALVGYHVLTGEADLAIYYGKKCLEVEPWNEEIAQLLMLIYARQGKRADVVRQYTQFQTELVVPPTALTQTLLSEVESGKLEPWYEWPIQSLDVEYLPWSDSPYVGLDTFVEADADRFFGRADLVDYLVGQIQTRPLVALVGASGSGKSSTIQAGIIPTLRQQTEGTIVLFRPTAYPFQSLVRAVVHAFSLEERADETKVHSLCKELEAGELSLWGFVARLLPNDMAMPSGLIVIGDQFEELFTAVKDEAMRHRFLDVLLDVITAGRGDEPSQSRLFLSFRADFMGTALQYRPLADALQESIEIVTSLTTDEMRQVIEAPARQLGVAFERGLVERMLADVSSEPEPLPLLEFALTVLWQWEVSRENPHHVLTHAAYEEIDGVTGAITHHADGVLAMLTSDERIEVRHVLLQLIRPGINTVDTRRVANRKEFNTVQWAMVRHLADNRLVVTGRDSKNEENAQIVHEALLRSWPQLQLWLHDDRAFRLWQDRLRWTITQWEKIGRDESGLIRGAVLGEAEEWLIRRPESLTAQEIEYLTQSLNLRDDQLMAVKLQQARDLAQAQALAESEHQRFTVEQQTNGRLRRVLVGLAISLLVVLGAVWNAYNQQQTARRLANLSQSLNLATSAQLALIEGESGLALALALEANGIENRPNQVRQILVDAAYTPGTIHRFAEHDGPVQQVLWHPDEQWVLSVSDDETMILWDVTTGELVWRISSEQGGFSPVLMAVFSPDGRSFFSVGRDGEVLEWETASGEVLRRLQAEGGHDGDVTAVALSPNGEWLLTGGEDHRLILWDVKTGEILRTYTSHQDTILALDFSDDGNRFVSGAADFLVAVWEIDQTEPIQIFKKHSQGVTEVAFWGDGNQVISAANDAVVWDILSGEPVNRVLNSSILGSFAFNLDKTILMLGTDAGHLEEWDMVDWAFRAQRRGHSAPIRSVAYSKNGRYVVSGSDDGTVRLWDSWSGAELQRFEYPASPGLLTLALTPDEKTALIGTGDGYIFNQPLTLGVQPTLTAVSADWIWGGTHLLPDGKTLVFGSGSRFSPPSGQTLHLLDIETGERLPVPEFRAGVSRLDLSNDGRWVLFTDLTGIAWLWDLENRDTLKQIEIDDPAAAMGVEFAPDGRTGIISYNEGYAFHVDLESGTVLGRFERHQAPLRALLIDADGKMVTTGAFDQKIELWDLEAYTHMQTLVGHQEFISQMRVLPQDPSFLLSVSGDKTMILWNRDTGQVVRQYRAFMGNPLDLRVSADGRTAYTVEDREAAVLRVWRLDLTDEDLYDWIEANRYVPEFTCDQRVTYNILPLCESPSR